MDCGLRTSYTSLTGKQKSWSHLADPPPPASWKQVNAGDNARSAKRNGNFPTEIDETVLLWGKYTGRTFRDAWEADKAYCFRVLSQG